MSWLKIDLIGNKHRRTERHNSGKSGSYGRFDVLIISLFTEFRLFMDSVSKSKLSIYLRVNFRLIQSSNNLFIFSSCLCVWARGKYKSVSSIFGISIFIFCCQQQPPKIIINLLTTEMMCVNSVDDKRLT